MFTLDSLLKLSASRLRYNPMEVLSAFLGIKKFSEEKNALRHAPFSRLTNERGDTADCRTIRHVERLLCYEL